jgi:hypothetical protein
LLRVQLFLADSLPRFAPIVPLGTSGWTASWDNSLDPVLSVVVDSQNATEVRIEKFVQFLPPPVGQPIQPIVITFQQTQANAVPHIVIEDEAVTNQTGVTWTDFHMELTDSGDAFFNPALTAASGGPPPIGWSIAPFTTAVFSAGPSGPNTLLDIAGGAVPNNTSWFPGAGINGDGALYITTNPHPQAPFTVFTLKEVPSVPEPISLSLVGLWGVLALKRRK